MGLVALGEQTVPSGITALLIAMMPLWVAVFGRVVFGERLPRIAIAGIAIGLRRRRRFSSVHRRRPTRRSIPAASSALLISPISWALGSLFSAHRARLPKRSARRDGHPDVRRRDRARSWCSVTGASTRRFQIEAVTRGVARRVRLPRDRRQPHRVHRVRLAPAGGAAAADRDLRLRQPDRRGHPRRDRAPASRSRRGPWSRARSSSSRSP